MWVGRLLPGEGHTARVSAAGASRRMMAFDRVELESTWQKQGEGELRAQGSSGYGLTKARVPCREQASLGERMQHARILGVVNSCLTEILELSQESLLSIHMSFQVRGAGRSLLPCWPDL